MYITIHLETSTWCFLWVAAKPIS